VTWPVIWSLRADADLLAIIDHIAPHNLEAAYVPLYFQHPWVFARGAKYLIPPSRYALHGGVQCDLASVGRRGREDPGEEFKLNSSRRKIREDHQVRVFESLRLLRERHLRRVVKEFVDHHLAERFHQGIGGHLVKVQTSPANANRTKHRSFAARDSASS
jgi:hypothetical protein